ncbi:uncharacterized protein LOC141901002 [Tubulanus polymorphus]|uniref:uncharacterized protein LOC141901002 n=1 Tax=Tubulanus polymorphus TaxID=672921 RepID=UPI003DA6BE01
MNYYAPGSLPLNATDKIAPNPAYQAMGYPGPAMMSSGLPAQSPGIYPPTGPSAPRPTTPVSMGYAVNPSQAYPAHQAGLYQSRPTVNAGVLPVTSYPGYLPQQQVNGISAYRGGVNVPYPVTPAASYQQRSLQNTGPNYASYLAGSAPGGGQPAAAAGLNNGGMMYPGASAPSHYPGSIPPSQMVPGNPGYMYARPSSYPMRSPYPNVPPAQNPYGAPVAGYPIHAQFMPR